MASAVLTVKLLWKQGKKKAQLKLCQNVANQNDEIIHSTLEHQTKERENGTLYED